MRLPAGDVSGRASDRGRGRPISLSLINHLLQSYGYFAVFAFIALESLGIPMPGETTLIAAAVYAGSTGHLNIGIVFSPPPRRRSWVTTPGTGSAGLEASGSRAAVGASCASTSRN